MRGAIPTRASFAALSDGIRWRSRVITLNNYHASAVSGLLTNRPAVALMPPNHILLTSNDFKIPSGLNCCCCESHSLRAFPPSSPLQATLRFTYVQRGGPP